MSSGSVEEVRVLLFGVLAERRGARELRVAAGPTVADVWAAVAGGVASADRDGVRPARNLSFCDWGTAVQGGDEVAFLPPVCGG